MANERMYLRCTVCGKDRFLAKTMGEGYYMAPEQSVMEAFYDDHDACTLGNWKNFALVYESDMYPATPVRHP